MRNIQTHCLESFVLIINNKNILHSCLLHSGLKKNSLKICICLLISFWAGYAPVSAKNMDAAQVTMKDSDGDGLSDSYEQKIGTEAYLADTDGDGVNDAIEVGNNLQKPLNHDNDRLIDARDPDDDNDGLPTVLEIKLGLELDSDKDGIRNYLDSDSDNDGVNDGLEAGLSGRDSDSDRIDDSFDADNLRDADENGDGVADAITLPDHDGKGLPDMLDSQYQYRANQQLMADKKQNKPVKHSGGKHKTKKAAKLEPKKSTKKITKQIAKKKAKQTSSDSIPEIIIDEQPKPQKAKRRGSAVSKKETKEKPVALSEQVKLNQYTDADNDGLTDSLEKILGTNPKKRDSDDDKVSDAIEIGMDTSKPQDSDHDGLIDALDPDDDNDGILSRDEDVNKDSSPINDDTDNDGVPNYLDANDDGDNKLTIAEGALNDTDKDGIPDYLDKNDGVKDKPLMVMKQIIPDEPETVVLPDPAEITEPEKQKFVVKQEVMAAPQTGREQVTLNALEKAISHNSPDLVNSLEQVNNPEQNNISVYIKPGEGKLDQKKQASLQHGYFQDEGGIIAWLKNLF